MDRRTPILAALGAATVLFVGGLLLGRALAPDHPTEDRPHTADAVVLRPARPVALDDQGEPSRIGEGGTDTSSALRLSAPAEAPSTNVDRADRTDATDPTDQTGQTGQNRSTSAAGNVSSAPPEESSGPADPAAPADREAPPREADPDPGPASAATPIEEPLGDQGTPGRITGPDVPSSFTTPVFVDWFDPEADDEALDAALAEIPMEPYEPPSTPVLPDDLVAIADTLDDEELEAAIDAAVDAGEVTVADASDLTEEERAEIGELLVRSGGFDWRDFFDEPIRLLGFVDPCADPDASPPADCPPGIGGTIIAPFGDGEVEGDGIAIPPLRLFATIYTYWNGWQRCENWGLEDNVFHGMIAASNPAEITVRYHSARAPEDGREIVVGPSADEVNRWVGATARGFGPFLSDALGWVHYCLALPIPAHWSADSNVMFEITGIDEFGDTDSFTTNFPIRLGRTQTVARPPITLEGDPASTLATLTVPYNRLREQVWIRVLPQIGTNRPTCTDVEHEVLDGTMRNPEGAITAERVRYPRRDGDGYVPEINDAIAARLAFEEGRTYRVCVWIVNPPRRSFDRPSIIRREQFEVRAPRFLRTQIWLESIRTDRPIDVGSISISTTNWRPDPLQVSSRSALAPEMAVDAGWTRLGRMVLDAGSYQPPWITTLQISHAGNTIDTAIPTRVCMFRLAPCAARFAGSYEVPIPGPDDTVIGHLELAVLGVAGPAGSPGGFGTPDGWIVGETSGFAADATPGEVQVHVEPRIDTFNTRLESGTTRDGQGRLALVAAFDREVRLLEVSPQLWSPEYADDTCHQPQVVDLDTFRSEHSVGFDVCIGAYYSMAFIAEDREGNRLDLITPRNHSYGPTTIGFGHERVQGYRVDDLEFWIVVERLGTGASPSFVRGTVFGVPINWSGSSSCIAGGVTSPIFGGSPVRPYGRAIQWHDEMVPFELEIGYDGPTECGPTGGPILRFEGGVRHRDLLGLEPGSTVFRYTDDDISFRIEMLHVRQLLD